MQRKTPNQNTLLEHSLSAHSPTREEVKDYIKDSGVSIVRIAEKLGVSRQLLSYWLKGKKRIYPEIFFKIKNAINDIKKEAEEMSNKHSIDQINILDNHIGNSDNQNSNSYSLAGIDDALIFERLNFNIFPILKKFKIIDGVIDMSSENTLGHTFFSYPDKDDKTFSVINSGDQNFDLSNLRSIQNKDILLCDHKQNIISGDICLLMLKSGRELVRQVIFQDEGRVILRCLNNQYPDINMACEDIDYMSKVVLKHSEDIAM